MTQDYPLFLSYRRDDGMVLATRMFTALEGRYVSAALASLTAPTARLSVFMDVSSLAAPDWKQLILKELSDARMLIVVCSFGARADLGPEDWFMNEIRWWSANRPTTAPILVADEGVSERWIPLPIKARWPHAQLVSITSGVARSVNDPVPPSCLERVLARIVDDLKAEMHSATLPDLPGLYWWKKDRHFKYLDCSESYASIAGFDSPGAMKGNSDDDMPWHELADTFRIGDHLLMSGLSPPRENVIEKEITVDGGAEILVTENQLLDSRGRCVGVQGFFIDITGCHLRRRIWPRADADGSFWLGENFDNQRLSSLEAHVLRLFLLRFPVDRIGRTLHADPKSIAGAILSLKTKMQCATDADVIEASTRAGLPFILFGPDVNVKEHDGEQE